MIIGLVRVGDFILACGLDAPSFGGLFQRDRFNTLLELRQLHGQFAAGI